VLSNREVPFFAGPQQDGVDRCRGGARATAGAGDHPGPACGDQVAHPVRMVAVRVADIPEVADLREHDQNATVVAAPPTHDDELLDRADLNSLPDRANGRSRYEREEESEHPGPRALGCVEALKRLDCGLHRRTSIFIDRRCAANILTNRHCVNIDETAMTAEIKAGKEAEVTRSAEGGAESDAKRTRRRYRQIRRAELEAQTRLRITEAAMKLHGTVGPLRTTVTAVAEEAGVQRGTVYRHFPDEDALFGACSMHWAALNPTPSPDAWVGIEDPAQRLRLALTDLYRWYERGQPMLDNVFRDAPLVSAMKPAVEGFQRQLWAVHAALMRGRRERGRRRARIAAAVGLAIGFGAWRSLVRENGLDSAEAVDLMAAMVLAAGTQQISELDSRAVPLSGRLNG
jgi:AcrR family transcriptional regulator